MRPVNGGEIIKVARLKAGLTQLDLAERLRTTQPQIVRWERGKTSPSFQRVVDAVRACGFELGVRVLTPSDEDRGLIEENLRLTPAERLDRFTERNREG